MDIDGRNLGAVAPLREQPKLGDFWIPRTGLFAIGRAFFDPFRPGDSFCSNKSHRVCCI